MVLNASDACAGAVVLEYSAATTEGPDGFGGATCNVLLILNLILLYFRYLHTLSYICNSSERDNLLIYATILLKRTDNYASI